MNTTHLNILLTTIQNSVLKVVFVLSILSISTDKLYSQTGCGPNVPSLNVDLSSNPNGAWISPDTLRSGLCCGAVSPDRCIEFNVLLHPNAVGIIFTIFSGAIPPGALYYQLNCGTPTPIGTVLCLNGPGPHLITFCKPGNNNNQYQILSVSGPEIGPNVTVNDGCSALLTTSGFDTSSITWNSVYPGNFGDFNGSLSCAVGCASTIFTSQTGLPPYIDYQVCGLPFGGCTTVPFCDTMRVYYNPTLIVNFFPPNPTICFGDTSITISAIGSGGSPPYSYQWSTGDTTQTINVTAGTYWVILSDTSNCPPVQNTITVTQFTNVITAFAGNDTTICKDFLPISLTGQVTGVTTGTWSGGNGTFSPHVDSLNITYNPSPSELAQGYAYLILTTTNNGTCPLDQDTIRIDFVDFISTVLVSTTNVSCAGASDGEAYVDVLGGTQGPYNILFQINPPSSLNPITGLAPGNYSVLVTNVYGCDTLYSFTITEPLPLLPQVDTIYNVSCNGFNDGYASISVSGGTPPYTFNWNTTPNSFTSTNTNLAAGTYIVDVVDYNGCFTTIPVTITEPPLLISTISSITNVSCFGYNDGTATALVNGGTLPYSYSWNTIPMQTTATVTNLSSGNYILTITDTNGCVTSNAVEITQPQPITATMSSTNTSCFGFSDGTANINVIGGTQPYSYIWNTTPIQSSNSANGLIAGLYTVIIQDVNNCSYTDSVLITEPTPLTPLLINSSNVSCYGLSDGEANVSVSGGTPSYSYAWNTIPAQNTTLASGLAAGNYTFETTDANGCVASINVNITQPDSLLLNFSPNHVSCNGGNDGSILANVSGGTATYTYNWTPVSGNNNQINMLTAGTYYLSIQDINGCVVADSVSIMEPLPVIVNTIDNDTICPSSTATISANATGGNGGYSYVWNQGLGIGQSHNVSPSNTQTYVVIAYDGLGCPSTPDTISVFVRLLLQDSLVISSGGDVCVGGIVTFYGNHNNSNNFNYNYSWSNGFTGLGPHNMVLNDTTTFVLTITDVICNISISDSVTINANPYPIINLPASFGQGCPPLSVNFFNNANNPANTTYGWSFGDGTHSNLEQPTYTFINSGTYNINLTAISAVGCMVNTTISSTVTVYPVPDAMFSYAPTEISILNPTVEFINESVGASAYNWNFGDGNTSLLLHPINEYKDTGNYVVRLIATNNFNCIDTHTVILRINPFFSLYIPNAFTPDGDGKNDMFFPKGVGISEDDFTLLIFDRWGELIFESHAIEKGWEGTYKGESVKNDVYVYKLNVKDIVHLKRHEFIGKVTLIR